MHDMLTRSLEQSAQGGLAFIMARVAVFFVMLVIGSAFSTIGGVLGALMFKKAPTPAQP